MSALTGDETLAQFPESVVDDRPGSRIWRHYVYRCQWVAAPQPVARAGWLQYRVGKLWLAAHPALPVSLHRVGSVQICLLGDAYDPRDPALNNDAIAAALAAAAGQENLLAIMHHLGGRWLLLAAQGESVHIYPDAGASLQVFYATDSARGWMGASPNLISEYLDLARDEELIAALDPRTPNPQPNRSFFWPGSRTPLRGLRRLLPNHYLDWRTATPARFWPLEPPAKQTTEQSARACFDLLRGTVDAVAMRDPRVYIALTAGYDSRTLLAASAHCANRIRYFALDHGSRSSDDRCIAPRLARQFGASFSEYPVHAPSAEFVAAYDQSTAGMMVGAARNISELYGEFPPDAVFLETHGSEVGRANYYHRVTHPSMVTPDYLCAISGFRGNHQARREFREFLDGLPADSGVRALDLFFWEMRLGCWSAVNCTGQDLVRRVFSPYNNRAVLSAMLAAPERARQAPFILHREISKLGLAHHTRNVRYNAGWRDRVRDWVAYSAARLLPSAMLQAARARAHRRYVEL